MARTQRAVKYLNDAVKEAGEPTMPEICKRAKAAGFNLKRTTARDILSGKSESPDVGNLEAIAKALGRPPLELISFYLKEPPEPTPKFEDSELEQLWKLYKHAKSNPKHKDEADQYVRFIQNALKGLK